jgi:hypothetical protein
VEELVRETGWRHGAMAIMSSWGEPRKVCTVRSAIERSLWIRRGTSASVRFRLGGENQRSPYQCLLTMSEKEGLPAFYEIDGEKDIKAPGTRNRPRRISLAAVAAIARLSLRLWNRL